MTEQSRGGFNNSCLENLYFSIFYRIFATIANKNKARNAASFIYDSQTVCLGLEGDYNAKFQEAPAVVLCLVVVFKLQSQFLGKCKFSTGTKVQT